MLEWLSQPWPWYVSGPMIGITVPILLLSSNKQLGISSSLQHMCAATLKSKLEMLNYDWKKEMWNLQFALGLIIGSIISVTLLYNPEPAAISQATKDVIANYGVTEYMGLLPEQIFTGSALLTVPGILLIVVGGFLIGFGTRYANGCTSGHSIMGISNLKLSSLVATISFFAGGLIMTHYLLPLILS